MFLARSWLSFLILFQTPTVLTILQSIKLSEGRRFEPGTLPVTFYHYQGNFSLIYRANNN